VCIYIMYRYALFVFECVCVCVCTCGAIYRGHGASQKFGDLDFGPTANRYVSTFLKPRSDTFSFFSSSDPPSIVDYRAQ
jgi:hypothetical protein